MRLHFLSGLPRSGSTLLAAILKQNPAITSGMSSPLCLLTRALVREMSTGEFAGTYSEERRTKVLRGLAENFYDGADCVLDTNRYWTAHLPLVAKLFPDARVICCVRNVGYIMNSIEKAIAKNPLVASTMFKCRIDTSVYERTAQIMDDTKGIVGRPYAALKEAWFGPHADRLILIDYEELCASPRLIVQRLYEACGWEPFTHDFQHVEYEADAFDTRINTPGLHRVSGPVRPASRALVIPPDIIDRYADSAFWANPSLNFRRVQVWGTPERLKAVS